MIGALLIMQRMIPTIEANQSDDLVVPRNWTHPHVEGSSVLCVTDLLQIPLCIYDFLCIMDNCMFFVGSEVNGKV